MGVRIRSYRASQRTCESTVCTDGMRTPWAMPTQTRASTMAAVLLAVAGVRMEAVDQRAKEMHSMMQPPQRCAAHPPGTCTTRYSGP